MTSSSAYGRLGAEPGKLETLGFTQQQGFEGRYRIVKDFAPADKSNWSGQIYSLKGAVPTVDGKSNSEGVIRVPLGESTDDKRNFVELPGNTDLKSARLKEMVEAMGGGDFDP